MLEPGHWDFTWGGFMKFTEFPVKRPVTIVMLMLIVLVLGGLSLSRLTVDLMPQIKFPNVSVITTYSGVASQEIEKSLTRPLESAIRNVPGIKNVKSTSQEGVSFITAEFPWGTNLDEASAAIRDRIGMVKKYLPTGMDEPLVLKIDISQIPVMMFSYTGDRDIGELKRLADDEIVPRIERVDGVASVIVSGGRDREIQVYVDKNRLLALGLSLDQVIMKIRYENLNISGGSISGPEQEFSVRGLGEFKDVAELQELVVGGKPDGSLIRLSEIARVVDGLSDRTSITRSDRKTGLTIIVSKQTDANTVQVAGRLKKAVPVISQDLPPDTRFAPVFDMSEMVNDAIQGLVRAALEGGILAIVIIFLFLLRFRPTLVVSLSIPLSLLLAFVGMYFGRMTINIMTLGGLLLALGRLVDDSIVVMENIFRHMRLGKSRLQAAVDGAGEVSTAVISSTLVTVVVFLPIVFATGIAGQLFKAFGSTVFYSLAASLLVAFTVVPMLSSRIFAFGRGVGAEQERGVYPFIRDFYAKALSWSLKHKGIIFGGAVLVLVFTGFLFTKLGKEFMPNFNTGMYQASVALPRGSSVEATSAVISRLEDKFLALPDVGSVTGMIGSSSGSRGMSGGNMGSMTSADGRVMVRIARDKKRVTTDAQISGLIHEFAADYPAVRFSMPQMASQLFGSERPIEIKIYGDDLDRLREISEQLLDQVKNVPGIRDPTSSVEERSPEIDFTFNRDRATQYGLTAAQVSNTVANALQGTIASIYREAGQEINIRVRLDTTDVQSFRDIGDVPITSPLGFAVPLRDIAEVKYGEGPSAIQRENAKRVAMVTADISGRPLSLIGADIAAKLKQFQFPQGYFYDYGGEQQSMKETFSSLFLVLILAMLLVYMILASLYESLIHPLTIMLSIPFAFTGAFAMLAITGTTLSTTSYIGLIMLVGIVATNAIVLIDFVIKNRERGMERHEAVVEAGRVRLRPILMTAIATLFAMIPLAFGRSEGVNLQKPMGVAVFGGLFSSTILTLIVIPCVYEVFDTLGTRFNRLLRRKPQAKETADSR
jgi:HAE1 family hydrophobic/amphiphilic exporter-1